MNSNPYLLFIFIASIAVLLYGIIKLKINPFLVLPAVGLLTGLASGLPLDKVTKLLADGFGQTLGSIGIVVGLGIILGNLLAHAGATEQIAKLFLQKVGSKKAPLAIAITGYLVCIPVFLNAAFIVFMPLLRDLTRNTKIPLVKLVVALIIAGFATHCLAIPTPGPLAVMGTLNLPVSSFLGWSLLIAIPPAVLGLIAANHFGKQATMQIPETESEHPSTVNNRPVPSGGLSLFVLLFPILLILIGSLLAEFLPKENSLRSVMAFLGDKNVAMLLGVALAAIALKPYCLKSFDELVNEGGANAGLLILIVGAGGSFGAIINGSGIANNLVKMLSSMELSYLWLGFLLTAILRAAQGSATVAAVTASSILAPMLASSSDNPVMVGLAICCGSMCFSFPNDSGFWVISKFSGLTVPQMLRAWTLTSTLSGVLGFACTLLLDWVL